MGDGKIVQRGGGGPGLSLSSEHRLMSCLRRKWGGGGREKRGKRGGLGRKTSRHGEGGGEFIRKTKAFLGKKRKRKRGGRHWLPRQKKRKMTS